MERTIFSVTANTEFVEISEMSGPIESYEIGKAYEFHIEQHCGPVADRAQIVRRLMEIRRAIDAAIEALP